MIIALTFALPTALPAQPAVEFTPGEKRLLAQHSPLPAVPPSPGNRLADDPRAAALGQALFFDPRLSANGKVSCATCHDPQKSFADGKGLSEGIGTGVRNAPALWNVAYNRWYFWDGRSDSLWAQALQPLERPLEMGSNRVAVLRRIAEDDALRGPFEELFGALPRFDAGWPADACPPEVHIRPDWNAAWAGIGELGQIQINRAFANVGKAIEAYERRLISRAAPFDVFVGGLASGDAQALAALSPAAQRGARMFVGRGNCRLCHAGPNFTDGEFHNIRIPPREAGAPLDPARFAAIELLLRDPFNAGGGFGDTRDSPASRRLDFLAAKPDLWGAVKTPSLRNVARTAPYMHQGQFSTLDDVLHFYSTFEGAVQIGHHANEAFFKPLRLTPEETADLKAFLESLTDERIDRALLRDPN